MSNRSNHNRASRRAKKRKQLQLPFDQQPDVRNLQDATAATIQELRQAFKLPKRN